MEDKIAIHCKREEDWDRIVDGFKGVKSDYPWNSYRVDSCLDIGEKLFCDKAHYEARGYTIISASEYLNERGKDVSEFKVGDRVECINEHDIANFGKTYTVASIKENSVGFEELRGGCIYATRCFRLARKQTKTQTTKENNMDLNSSIRTVFVEEDKAAFDIVEKMQSVFGGEIAEDFTGAMTLRNNKDEYLAEIKRLDDIEAKRLKDAAKEGK